VKLEFEIYFHLPDFLTKEFHRGQDLDWNEKMQTLVLSWMLMLSAITGAVSNYPVDMFETTSHNFGTVVRGSKTEFDFVFTNKYVEDVVIESVTSSCQCTTPSFGPRGPIKTHQQGRIHISINTQNFTGNKNATITVRFAKPYRAEMQLHSYVFIRSDVSVNPGIVYFGSVDPKKSTPMVPVNLNSINSGWRIQDVRSNCQFLSVKLQQPNPQYPNYYTMAVMLKENAPPGPFSEILEVITNDYDQRSRVVPIRVEGRIKQTLSVSPSPLAFNIVEEGKKVEKTLIVQGAEPFQILDITSENRNISATIDNVRKKIQPIKLIYSGNEPGEFNGKVTIFTDLEGKMDAAVNFSGKVIPRKTEPIPPPQEETKPASEQPTDIMSENLPGTQMIEEVPEETPEAEAIDGEVPVPELPAEETPEAEEIDGGVPAPELPAEETPEAEEIDGGVPAPELPAKETPEMEAIDGEVPVPELPAEETPEANAIDGEVPVPELPAKETPEAEEIDGGIPAPELPAKETPEAETIDGGVPAPELPAKEDDLDMELPEMPLEDAADDDEKSKIQESEPLPLNEKELETEKENPVLELAPLDDEESAPALPKPNEVDIEEDTVELLDLPALDENAEKPNFNQKPDDEADALPNNLEIPDEEPQKLNDVPKDLNELIDESEETLKPQQLPEQEDAQKPETPPAPETPSPNENEKAEDLPEILDLETDNAEEPLQNEEKPMENKIPAENANDGIGQDEKEEDNADEIPQNDLEDLLPEDVSLVPEDGTASSSLPAQQQPSVIGRNLLKQKI